MEEELEAGSEQAVTPLNQPLAAPTPDDQEINFVEVTQQIPTFEQLTPDMQEYVVNNFNDLDEDDLRAFQPGDPATTRKELEQRRQMMEEDRVISEAFSDVPTRESVTQERRVLRSRVQERTTELFPDLEGEDLNNITNTISEILEREQLRGNPMSALYGQDGAMNETAFTELETFTTVGQDFENLRNSRVEAEPDDLTFNSPVPEVVIEGGIEGIKSTLSLGLGLGQAFTSEVLDTLGFISESPALLSDLSESMVQASAPAVENYRALFDFGGQSFEESFAGQFDEKFNDVRKQMTSGFRDIFRGNKFSTWVRDLVEKPTDMDGEIFGRVRDGDYAGAGRQFGYMISSLAGSLVGSAGVGLPFRAIGATAPRLTAVFSTVAAERVQQAQLAEGVPLPNSTANAMAYGVANLVLSEYVVLEKLKYMTGTAIRDYGAKSGSEFAIGAVTNLAKTAAFDGTLMATSEGLLAVSDYVTGVTDEMDFYTVLNRVGNGFALGFGGSLLLTPPTRYMGLKNRINRAQQHFDSTLAMSDLYNMVQTIENPRMRDAVITLMKDSADLPGQTYVNPRDIGKTLKLTDAEFIERSGINPDVFQSAKESGQSVSVPIELVVDAMAANPDGSLNFGEFRQSIDGPTALESAAYIDSVDRFYSGVLRREIKAGTLVDELLSRIRVKDLPSRSSDSLAQSARSYIKAMYNGSFGRVRDIFGKENIVINEPQTPRGPRVDFTGPEVPDVPARGDTLRTLPPSLDDTPATARVVFPEKVVDSMIEAEGARSALNKEYKEFSDRYRIVDEADRLANENILGVDNPNFNALRLQRDLYENIVNDASLNDAAELVLGNRVSETTGLPFRIDYSSFVELYGKQTAAKLARGFKDTLFTTKKSEIESSLLMQDALTELGLTPEKFAELLADKDVRGVVREGGVDWYATKESEKLTQSVVRNMERYNKMVTMDKDPLISAYERWLKDESANEIIDKHLTKELEDVRAAEVARIEEQLPKEFIKRQSGLIKGGRVPKEMKDAIMDEIMDYDYKYVQKSAFMMDALNLERYYDRQAADMVRFGNMKQAYINKTQAAKMHEYAKAQYKAIRLAKQAKKTLDRIKDTEIMDFNEQGYDTDYVFAARLVMNKAGLTRGNFGANEHFQVLAQQDPAKYEMLVERFDRFIPETQEGMSLAQYATVAQGLTDLIEGSKGEARNYKIGDVTVGEAVETIFDQLMAREQKLLDVETNGQFSLNARAKFTQMYKDAIVGGTNPDKVDIKGLQIQANEITKSNLNIAVNPEGVGTMANYVAQSFGIMGDFLYSLKIPELSRLADMIRESNSSLINALNAPGGQVDFLRTVTKFVNEKSDTLAYRGVKQFAGRDYTSSQLNALVLNMGNEGNFARLALREFGVEASVLKQYIAEAIERGVITQDHFTLAQLIGGRYEVKFNELQPHIKQTYGRFVKPINKDFPLSDIVPEGWVKGGWYAPVKTVKSPVSDKSMTFKKSEQALERAQEQFARDGFYQDLTDIVSEQPVEASYERRRTSIEGARLSLDMSDYLNQLVHMEKVIHTRDAAVAANQVFLDPAVFKSLDSISPGVMENTIWPALKAFNDQTIHSGAIGDIRMETAHKSIDKVTGLVTGTAGKIQIAYNLITPFLNIGESGKVADLLRAEGISGRQNRMRNLTDFAGRMGHLALHREKVEYLQELMPYLKARQQNSVVEAQRSLEASMRLSLAFRAGLPASRRVSQMNALVDNMGRVADHWTQGLVDATTASMFLDGYLDKGVPLDEALRLTERAVEQTMPGYFSSELYAASRGNTGRMLFQYMNWAVKSLNYTSSRARDISYQYADDFMKRYGAMGGLVMFALVVSSAMEDTIRGLISGRNSLDDMAEDFTTEPAVATVRLTGQLLSAPFERIPVFGQTLRRTGMQLTSTLVGDEETHPGYLYNVYNAGATFQAKDLVSLPAFGVLDTPARVGRGLYKYGTEGEYQRAYDLFGNTRYSSVDTGTAVSEIMTLMGMMGAPIPAGPGPRNSVKYIFNLSTGEDSISDSGLLLDLLRGRGENLDNPPRSTGNKKLRW